MNDDRIYRIYCSISVVFNDSQKLSVEETSTISTCALAEGEKIYRVRVYTKLSSTFISGLEFTTSAQTCGPYGTPQGELYCAEGHQLLFIGGRTGALLEGIELHFDYDCVPVSTCDDGPHL